MRAIQFTVVFLATTFCLVMEGGGSDDLKSDREGNQWRGPNRDGQVAVSGWLDRLTENYLQQRWRVDLGPRYSGLVVSAEAIFVIETKDHATEAVRALSRATGKE